MTLTETITDIPTLIPDRLTDSDLAGDLAVAVSDAADTVASNRRWALGLGIVAAVVATAFVVVKIRSRRQAAEDTPSVSLAA
jgi:hypothetical protein